MNERIQELERQAKQYANSMYPSGLDIPKWGPAYHEKFAELIVRECAGLFPNVYVEIETDYGNTPVIAADYIKEHFGVEE